MVNSTPIVIAKRSILSSTTSGALDVIPLNPETRRRRFAERDVTSDGGILFGDSIEWRWSSAGKCDSEICKSIANTWYDWFRSAVALTEWVIVGVKISGAGLCDFHTKQQKCCGRRWVIVHLMISSFSSHFSREHFFPFNLKVVWKYFRNFNVIGKLFHHGHFNSEAFHQANRSINSITAARWISTWMNHSTKSKLWRCEHSSTASFSATRRSSFSAFIAALLLTSLCNFRFKRREKKKDVCTDLKSSFLYLSRVRPSEKQANSFFVDNFWKLLLLRLLLAHQRWMGNFKEFKQSLVKP